jgi:NAD(P)H-dependent FMN reductase
LTDPVHILGFAGSLRKASYNKRLIQIASEVAPAGITLESYDLIQLFDSGRAQKCHRLGFPPHGRWFAHAAYR